jgi:hypothetical protein
VRHDAFAEPYREAIIKTYGCNPQGVKRQIARYRRRSHP